MKSRVRKPLTNMQNAHTRKTAYTFFCILQLTYKEDQTKPTVFKTEPNLWFFSKPKLNLKNSFCISLAVWNISDKKICTFLFCKTFYRIIFFTVCTIIFYEVSFCHFTANFNN